MSFFRSSTPLEQYLLDNGHVWVKRDDLFARWPAPPLGKLRGARALLRELYRDGVRLVGCWDTRISALGQGITICARELPGLKVIVAYPASRGSEIPDPLRVASQFGAKILPVRAGRITISFADARKRVEASGGVLLPFGLDCIQSVSAIEREAARIPDSAVSGGTVVVSCGSGVTLAGLLRGLGARPSRYIGVSCGRSIGMIQRCLSKYVENCLDVVELIPPVHSYSKQLALSCPFPTHPNYDLKAWAFLRENFRSLRAPVFFWNVGAIGHGPVHPKLKLQKESSGRDGVLDSAKPSSAKP
jgi:1-aminocyclopropane-1-carboxylate deaminase/D-cysteine desulfhydrase-like pyridoxal-dependent ACC family enzyme